MTVAARSTLGCRADARQARRVAARSTLGLIVDARHSCCSTDARCSAVNEGLCFKQLQTTTR
eukprot:709614-Rhodomonas_salina.1